jgi:hypothetical protein
MTVLVISPDYASHLLPLATLATAWQQAGEPVVVATGAANAALVDQFGYQRVDLRLGRGSNPGIIKVDDQPRGEDDNLRAFFAATRRGMIDTLRYQADARRNDLLWNPVASARRVIEIVEAIGPQQILVDHLAFGATLGLRAAGIAYTDVVLGHPTALPVGDELYGGLPAWPSCFAPGVAELDELHGLCREVTAQFTDDWNHAARQVHAGAAAVDDAFRVHGDQVMFNYPDELHDRTRTAQVHAEMPGATFLGASVRDDDPPADVARWLDGAGGRPVVYVGFGSFLSARGDVLATVAGALRRMDVDVMLATGSTAPSELGELPERWLVRPYLPQVSCLARADVAITHGGNNSVTESLYHGVPMVVLPFSTDQFAGAAAIERHGSGRVLAPNELHPTALAAAVAEVLHGPHGASAGALGQRLRAQPGPQAARAATHQPPARIRP